MFENDYMSVTESQTLHSIARPVEVGNEKSGFAWFDIALGLFLDAVSFFAIPSLIVGAYLFFR